MPERENGRPGKASKDRFLLKLDNNARSTAAFVIGGPLVSGLFAEGGPFYSENHSLLNYFVDQIIMQHVLHLQGESARLGPGAITNYAATSNPG